MWSHAAGVYKRLQQGRLGTMKNENWEVWRSLLSKATIELFECYGVELRDQTRWTPVLTQGDHVAGSIYFGGEDIRGGLTLCASRTVLDIAIPIAPCLAAPLSDFARELANQILGILKVKLTRYGIDFSHEFTDPEMEEASEEDPARDARTL